MTKRTKHTGEMTLQIQYCEETGRPMFAPKDGHCYFCGALVEDTDEEHLIGCDVCHKSWCD